MRRIKEATVSFYFVVKRNEMLKIIFILGFLLLEAIFAKF